MLCPRCDTTNPKGSVHCFNCGQNLSEPASNRPIAATGTGAAVRTQRVPKEFGRIDIGGTFLVVNEEQIVFDKRGLQAASVTGIRYGIYKHYINGIRSSQSYCIWLTNNSWVMQIECAKGFFVSDSTIQKRYEDALKSLYQAVMVPMIQRFLTLLDEGPGFVVGDLTFDKSGIHRAGSLGAIEKGFHKLIGGATRAQERDREYQHLPWNQYGGHSFDSGYVRLHRQKAVWAQLPLRDTWNAVCLGPMLDFLNKDGRLWQFVNR